MRQATTDKEHTMLTLPMARRIIDSLRKPFIQRLITLIVSALLAMSLISMTMLLTVPPSGHEVAASSSIALPAYLDESHIQGFAPRMGTHGQTDAQAIQHDDRERRLV